VFYVYILQSELDHHFYTGFTNNLQKRIEEHNLGKVTSTKKRKPFTLIYYEACITKEDAIKREKYLKTTYGKRYIYNRLKNYLATIG